MTTKGCLPPDGPPCIQSCESTLTKGCEFCTFHNNLGEHGTDDQITGGDGDSEGDRSRPPTPFSRPLTARNVAQRPATTTIFERESDAKRASRQGCQMAIAGFLDRMCLALRASGLCPRYATLQNLIPSCPWIAPPRPPPWRNPRKGRDQILQRSVAEP